eukprot:2088741-Prymnesium_polylepis.1
MHTCSSRKGAQPHRMPNKENNPSAAASHQQSSLESSAVPCAMHTCSSRTRGDATKHKTMQVHICGCPIWDLLCVSAP